MDWTALTEHRTKNSSVSIGAPHPSVRECEDVKKEKDVGGGRTKAADIMRESGRLIYFLHNEGVREVNIFPLFGL